MNYPKIRFQEFSDSWQSKKLGDFTVFTKGKNISKSDITQNGDYECIRYGELYTHYNEVIDIIKSRTSLPFEQLLFSKANDIIIPSSGETAIDIATASCVLKDNVALGGDLNILRTTENGVFLAYYLNSVKKQNISSLAQGNSVVHLYAKQLKDLNVNIPNRNEQNKISMFIQKVDNRINFLKEKKTLLEQYKKALMQKIFSQELRFKDEMGNYYPDWTEMLLGDMLNYEQPTKYLVRSTEYKPYYPTPVLTAGKSFILGYTDETDGIFANNLPVIIFDDFTTATQFVDFPFKAKSSAMKILRAQKDHNIIFLYEAIQNIKFEVGGHSRHWISIFSSLTIQVPSLIEQNKIALFIEKINHKIKHEDDSITASETWKKALLQQMFV